MYTAYHHAGIVSCEIYILFENTELLVMLTSEQECRHVVLKIRIPIFCVMNCDPFLFYFKSLGLWKKYLNHSEHSPY